MLLKISLEKNAWGSLQRIPVFFKGVSALYAGVIEGNLLIAGGCNFPDIPVADGGKKSLLSGYIYRPFVK